jgi:hypothetical protein
MEVSIDEVSGKVSFDLYEYLEYLPDELKQKLGSEHYWAFGIQDGFKEALAHTFAGNTYNSTLHKIRTDLLTSEYMPDVLREWAEGIVRDMSYSESRSRYYQALYFSLHGFLSTNYYDVLREAPKEPQYSSSYSPELKAKVMGELAALGVTWPDPVEEDDDPTAGE